jgi:DNA replication ATP-dependent helicase Dna2
MNDVLTAWPSHTFYHDMIRPAPGVGERRLQLKKTDPNWEHILDPDHPSVFLDLGHRNTMTRSRTEAEVVCELVQSLIHSGIPPAEIGVVVPYRSQGRLIRNLLRHVLRNRDMLKELVVDTVERMQGQEREVVLISLTTSSPTFATQLAEFFFQPERLNVAITRPRTKLIILGSKNVLKAEPDLPEVDSWVDLLRDLISTCTSYDLSNHLPLRSNH